MLNTAETLNQGLELHRRGDLAGAERLYRQVLAANPREANAWHLLGLVAHSAGSGPAAVECIRRAIQLDGGQPSFHTHLAEAYRLTGELPQAEAAARQAVRLNDAYAVGHNTLGAIFREQGRLAEAEAGYRRAVELDPRFALAHSNLAGLLFGLGRLEEAEAYGRLAVGLDPTDATAHCQLGNVLRDRGQVDEAKRSLVEALRLNPTLADAHFALGVVLQRQNNLAAARQCYERAIAIRPEHAEAYNNLGTLYRVEGDYQRAADRYRKALEFAPDAAEVLNNLGNVLKRLGQVAEATARYDRALAIAPDNASAHYNRGLVLLAAGQWAEGWLEYDWRDRCPEFEHREFEVPRWTGEPLAGRTLLVHAEQGLGDTLQFVRYLPLLAERGGRIVLEVQPALVPLLRQAGLDRFAELVGRGKELPKFDLHVPLLSLPEVLGTTLENIPAAGGYLQADPALVETWRGRLAELPGYRVGIAWQGSPTYRDDRERSIPLEAFARLAIEGVSLVSLQKGPGTEQLDAIAGRFSVHDLGDDFDGARGAFIDTAGVMKNLDLVVTSDTAIAHLAGALGVPVWVALSQVADWRWLEEREDSPWYTSMRLFRQRSRGDWEEVFERMAKSLPAARRQDQRGDD